jgi:hypothetical protein
MVSHTPIIRDFAYVFTDPRHSGVHQTDPINNKKELKQIQKDEQSSILRDNTGDDEDSKWKWSANSIEPIDSQIILKISTLLNVKISKFKVIFPFEKSQECEMSLIQNQMLLGVCEVEPTDSTVRWSSIDQPELKLDQQLNPLTLEPPTIEFIQLIKSFQEFLGKYGQGWVLCVKVTILGKDDATVVKLRDLGLVPVNYIEIQ